MGDVAIKAGGAVAFYLILFMSSRIYYSDFRQEQLNIAEGVLQEVLRKHDLQITDLDRAAMYYRILAGAVRATGVQVDRVKMALESVSEQIALKDKLIGQYCYFFRPLGSDPKDENATMDWYSGSLSILDVSDSVAPQIFGRVSDLELEFKSRRLQSDKDGIFYDWMTKSVFFDPGKTRFGVAQLGFKEWSKDRGQVVWLTGNFTDFRSPASHLQLIRKDDKYYGQMCPDIASKVGLTLRSADELKVLVEQRT